MKPDYNYIFHYSALRGEWAYVHRDDLSDYWNGKLTAKSRVTYGASPTDCLKKAVEKDLHK